MWLPHPQQLVIVICREYKSTSTRNRRPSDPVAKQLHSFPHTEARSHARVTAPIVLRGNACTVCGNGSGKFRGCQPFRRPCRPCNSHARLRGACDWPLPGFARLAAWTLPRSCRGARSLCRQALRNARDLLFPLQPLRLPFSHLQPTFLTTPHLLTRQSSTLARHRHNRSNRHHDC